MNSMATFNPDQRCHVHDGLNDKLLNWDPEWATHYRKYAAPEGKGVVAWDGLLLDGWTT